MTGTGNIAEPTNIRMRHANETPVLHEIERRASLRFAEHGFESLAGTTAVNLEAYDRLLDDHETFVAEMPDGMVAGFAATRDLQGIFWLSELSVLPEYGRRGIGTALLKAVIERARWSDYAAIGLATFKVVPFNAPFYSKHGFMQVETADLPTFLADEAAGSCPEGIHPATRVVMIKRL